jgi:hypothetical protein
VTLHPTPRLSETQAIVSWPDVTLGQPFLSIGGTFGSFAILSGTKRLCLAHICYEAGDAFPDFITSIKLSRSGLNDRRIVKALTLGYSLTTPSTEMTPAGHFSFVLYGNFH